MTTYRIPLSAGAQTFTITLGDQVYIVNLVWVQAAEPRDVITVAIWDDGGTVWDDGGTVWDGVTSISPSYQGFWKLKLSAQDGTVLVDGIPLVTGCDLLGQYQHLGFNGGMVVQTLGNIDEIPTYDTLGTSTALYFITT